MEFLADYGLFFAKLFTLLVALLILIAFIGGMRLKEKMRQGMGQIEVRHWNDKLRKLQEMLRSEVLDKPALKQLAKQEKHKQKQEAKQEKQQRKAAKQTGEQSAEPDDGDPEQAKHNVYVINFHGDIRAQAVDALREEITAVLSVANAGDEVVIKLESGGGLVHAYGLASSQLLRVKEKSLKLTICVDKVAASGGYMMAAVADHIIAAPFAVLGSIGVLAQIPNFHRFLKKHDVDFEMLTAGEYKRTLTMLGENTDKGRKKFQNDLEDTHNLFKEFVAEHRSQLDLAEVATGEVWFGKRALDKGLIDELCTSDAYLVARCEESEVYEVKYTEKKPLQERIGVSLQTVIDNLAIRWLERLSRRDAWF